MSRWRLGPKIACGLVLVVAVSLATFAPQSGRACPFCSAVSLTFSEELANADIAVVAKIVERPEMPAPDAPLDAPTPLTKFQIVKVLKGGEILGDAKDFGAVYFGQDPDETPFLLMGIGKTDTQWGTPIALTDRSVEYLSQLQDLPAKGPERLAFFQEYFEDPEDLLARDAFEELARAPYADLKALKDRMHREKLLAWIDDPRISASHRRGYLSMLSVCGLPEDIPHLEQMIKSEDREVRTAIDAMIACYLTLKGPDGLPLIEELFLKLSPAQVAAKLFGYSMPELASLAFSNAKGADYVDTYNAIMALRFHQQEETSIPKERLLASFRYMLDRPDLADMVIADLARFEDWSVRDKLAELYRTADARTSFVRVPIIQFMKVCPQPEAKALLDEFAKIDPDAYERAASYYPLGAPDSSTDVAAAPPAADGQQAPDQAAPGGAGGAGAPQGGADDLPPAPVADRDAPALPAAAVAGESPAEPAAGQAEPKPAQAETAPAAEAATKTPAPRPAPAPSAPTGWMVYVAPLVVAVVLFIAFQFLLRANRGRNVA